MIKTDHRLNINQIEDMIDAAPTFEVRTVFALMFYAGLRVSEALDINKHTLDWSTSLEAPNPVMIVKGKGNKTRVIPIAPALRQFLYGKYNRKKLPVKIKMLRQNVNYHINSVFKKMPWRDLIKFKVSPHTFRHSAAGYYISKMPINQVQALMGHSNIQITHRYISTRSANSQAFKEAFEAF